MFFFSPSRQEQGFTLVEILVTIGIIAIISSIAVPVFINQRQKAYDAELNLALKNIASSATVYGVEQDGFDDMDIYRRALIENKVYDKTRNVADAMIMIVCVKPDAFAIAGYHRKGAPNGHQRLVYAGSGVGISNVPRPHSVTDNPDVGPMCNSILPGTTNWVWATNL